MVWAIEIIAIVRICLSFGSDVNPIKGKCWVNI
jgi:hypothetical protein